MSAFNDAEDDVELYYHPGGAGQIAVEGIFREAGVAANPGISVEVETESPELHVIERDLAAAGVPLPLSSSDEVSRVTPAGTRRYRVASKRPDGEGMVRLTLVDAAP